MKAPALVLLLALVACVGCEQPVFTEAQLLGGVSVPAESLEQGRRVYGRYCVSCHGVKGDGRGVSSYGQWPPPRDFRLGKFKFAGVKDRELPTDDALKRIIRGGLAGTYMRPWRLRDSELDAVVQYIKTFSVEDKGFRSKRARVSESRPSADPFATPEAIRAAVVKGEELYHASFQCSSCHPSYATGTQFTEWDAYMRLEKPFDSVPKWSVNYRSVLLPPDFLRHEMRAVQLSGRAGQLDHEVEDLYRTIAFGLQGPMPGYAHLGEEDVWAVAHYVKSLADTRGSQTAQELRATLLDSPPQVFDDEDEDEENEESDEDEDEDDSDDPDADDPDADQAASE